MKKIFLIIFVALCTSYCNAQCNAWNHQNPYPTLNILNSSYFTNANNGYTVGDGGTILKTTNAGSDWTIITSGTTNNLNSVCFTDANTGYAVGDGGTILKTTNAGIIWTSLASGTMNILNSVCFTDANTGYAVGDGGTILKTTNAGSNWTIIASGTTTNLKSVCFTDANNGFAVGRGKLLKTINAGITWTTPLNSYNHPLNFIYFTDSTTGYILNGRNILISTTAWISSTGIATPSPDTLNSICFTDANTGYAVGDSGVITKTTDAGSNWTRLTSGTTYDLNSVCFTDANTGYAMGYRGTILKTTNAGSSWQNLTSATSKNINSICFTDANTGYAAGDKGAIVKTTNAGSNWTSLATQISQNINSICFTDANTGYTVGYGMIKKTTDAGNSWTYIVAGVPFSINFYSICFTDANTGYIVGDNGTIVKTINAGSSWTSLTSGTTKFLHSVYFTDANTGYTVGDSGKILKTINAGSSWTSLTSGTTKFLHSVYFTDANTGYTSGDGGTILKTTNAGSSWTSLTSGTSNQLNSVYFTDANTGYTVGSSGTIKKTINAGSSWTSLTSGTTSFSNSVYFTDANTGYVVGDSGVILKTINRGEQTLLPESPGTIIGISTVCQGQNSVSYTVPTITNATSYVWTLPNGATGTSNTNSITVNYGTAAVSGNITVKGNNACGDGTSSTLPITLNPLVASAGTISGAATACQGQNSVTYNVPTIANATSYIWTLPNGATGTSTTNSITVNYGASAVSGNITVKGHNSCGDGAIATLPITVNPLVASAGTISGVATACQGQNSVTYNVPTIDNATSYIWTLPNGATGTSATNSITVNYGASAVSGNITVKGHNSCGDGAISTLPITVNPLPSSAGNISGTSTICLPENAVTYTVPTISNATSYIWTLPNGASGTSTTNSISVTYGTATTGNITVKGHNDCGDGAISTLPITITQTPPTPTISNIGNNVLSSSSTSGNQWYNQNGIINGAVSQNYTVTANGSFYVIVKVGDCYSDSSSHIQITNTGIENNNSNDVFSIYPNPTKNSLNITVNQKLIGSEFTITDQLGRTVITGKLTAENTVVEVGNLSNGIYLLRIGANAQQTFKVVKE